MQSALFDYGQTSDPFPSFSRRLPEGSTLREAHALSDRKNEKAVRALSRTQG
jgi:hypothetical protein